jgi:hypothetical protein
MEHFLHNVSQDLWDQLGLLFSVLAVLSSGLKQLQHVADQSSVATSKA